MIPGKELATGVNYFSTVMTIKVTDPVDGSTLTNTSADYKYSYGGKTLFSRQRLTMNASVKRRSSLFLPT